MFFGFCPFGTYSSFHSNEPIQLWQTKLDIIGNLMIKDVKNKYRKQSSILDIYKNINPNDDTDIIELKKFGDRRNKLLNYLKEKGINNWISSVEDKSEMEFFIFLNQEGNSKYVEYLNEIDKNYNENLNSFVY